MSLMIDDIDPNTFWRVTELHAAASDGDVDKIRTLLRNGADQKVQDALGRTPFHCAVCSGNVQAAKMLMFSAEVVNAKAGSYNDTPLHYAAFFGHYEMAVFLVNSGADKNAKDYEKRTPVDIAADKGDTDEQEVGRILVSRFLNNHVPDQLAGCARAKPWHW